ncbi:hypothetical protein J155_03552 [Xanthomonas citri pv. citri]|uniref:Uncharacterized protein n=1 Tax=Xanthomonas citri pv. citri TaxID=611301 RepID=A0A0U5BWS1_XANCI|nr:hypothetical protein J151_03572 [Xanthomonas citri subsp. citri A306]AJY83492.1 hypothetical protein J159_03547 [Xanthomonas citri pv. citri]AJY92361.1 hypothetical protein J169_03570 [Xanthomonas citri pv. citri]AJY96809.1 hypothetical protein J164_03547 [Xanthomonas citri pv. citri]AJZ01233.1 hypothetical protein J163_03546 [Xanthomonas citri pv. citri]
MMRLADVDELRTSLSRRRNATAAMLVLFGPALLDEPSCHAPPVAGLHSPRQRPALLEDRLPRNRPNANAPQCGAFF